MIQGIWADEADQLDPNQWVNVYEINSIGAIYYDTCQVKDLELDEPSEYGLELTEEI
jgi:hypothetical protein